MRISLFQRTAAVAPPDFAAQLGTKVHQYANADPVIHQVTAGLRLYAAGDVERGYRLLTSKKVLPEKQVPYSPSQRHGYVYTEILRLITQACERAALPQKSDLTWITRYDSVLHDLLVNRMSPVQPLSCAGIVAHYRTEFHAGRAFDTPMVQGAQQAYADSLEH